MIEQVLERLQPQRPQGLAGGVTRMIAGVATALQRMHQRRRQRIALTRLDPRLLDDIGVSAEAARREAAKPPWRA